jgi:hypothetical protein
MSLDQKAPARATIRTPARPSVVCSHGESDRGWNGSERWWRSNIGSRFNIGAIPSDLEWPRRGIAVRIVEAGAKAAGVLFRFKP